MSSFVTSRGILLLILLGLSQVCGFFLVADSSHWRQQERNLVKEFEDKRKIAKLIDYLDYEPFSKDYETDQEQQLDLTRQKSVLMGSFGPWRGKRNIPSQKTRTDN